ncbi:hypothetical protein [Streptomyces sp. NPDC002054]|uniref:hypothetical protein n=1 Tax=Streptomyces sp. NPDC002054 TaxID=3154663 RepID=UPI00331EBB35
MSNHGDLGQHIRALSDEEAVRALTVVAEERGLLPAARQLSSSGAELRDAVDVLDREEYLLPGQPVATEGELARIALEYAAAQHEDLAQTIGEAVEYVQSPMDRIDPATISVAALVVTFLQTEVIMKRDTRGKWTLTIHKRALRDSALGRVLTALLSQITSGK